MLCDVQTQSPQHVPATAAVTTTKPPMTDPQTTPNKPRKVKLSLCNLLIMPQDGLVEGNIR